MAVSLTRAQLAVALRVDDNAETSAILDRDLATAVALVEDYAPDAPTAVQDAAAVRVASFLYDSDPSSGRAAHPLRQSGAESLLARYRVTRLFGPMVVS